MRASGATTNTFARAVVVLLAGPARIDGLNNRMEKYGVHPTQTDRCLNDLPHTVVPVRTLPMAGRKRKPAKGQMPLDFWRQTGKDDHWLQLAEREATEAERTPDTAIQDINAARLVSTVTKLDFDQAETLIKKAGGVHKLAQLPAYVLENLPGLTPEQAAQIRAMTDWSLLLSSNQEKLASMQVRMPTDVANLMMTEMGLLEREELRVVSLDTKNYVAGIDTLYQGSVNTITVRVAEVLRMPITHNATAMILLHNHPTGDPTPSPEDVRLTELVVDTARQMDIELLDHLVVGRNRFVSLKERGLGFG